jgi:cellulose synthase/poly-beta-1,6-N-acetylglucosamine synthase-like glycosyltransferase
VRRPDKGESESNLMSTPATSYRIDESQHVTVCICTRDRGPTIARTLRSIAGSGYDDYDVVVIDQSRSDDTEQAIAHIGEVRTRLTYARSQTVGSAVAHNLALERAHGPLVAFTDDDCEVSPDWLRLIVAHFHANPRVGEVCGAVIAGPHDPKQGFIPDSVIKRTAITSSPWLKWRERGIGANMAFRLDVLRAVGPFDPALGPGAPFRSCLDGDMTYRLLRAGYAVLDVPDAYVIHHGFRSWDEGTTLMRGVGLGMGAAYMKHLRLGDVAVIPTLAWEWVRFISLGRLITLRRRSGLARFAFYTRGVLSSFHYPIDRFRRIYIVDQVAG